MVKKDSRTESALEHQKLSQIAELCFRFSEVPIPVGMRATEMTRALGTVWNAGYETGRAEILGNTRINVNVERERQVGESAVALNCELPLQIELLVHVWTVGLLTAREQLGVTTPTMAGQNKLTQVKVKEDA